MARIAVGGSTHACVDDVDRHRGDQADNPGRNAEQEGAEAVVLGHRDELAMKNTGKRNAGMKMPTVMASAADDAARDVPDERRRR